MSDLVFGLFVGLVIAACGAVLTGLYSDVGFTVDDVDEFLLVCKNNHEVKTYNKDNNGTITVRCNDGAIFERESGND